MKPIFKEKSITLVELITAMVIFSVIIVALTSIEKFSRYHVIMGGRRSQLQNDASNVLEHMTKTISQAIGSLDDLPVRAYNDGRGLRIRIDDPEGTEPGVVDADDRWVAYRHENIGVTDSEIRYYPDAGNTETPQGVFVSLTNRVVITNVGLGIFGLRFDGNFTGNLLEDNTLDVEISTCWEPAAPAPNDCGSVDNPSVTMATRITMPSVSIN